MNRNAFYRIFPETARNFEGDILRDLRRGFNVRVEFREPVRLGPLMLAPELARQTKRGELMGKLVEGNIVKLVRITPPPEIEGLCLVGEIVSVMGPMFTVLAPGSDVALHFRSDENEELAVRVLTCSVWEIAESIAPVDLPEV